MMRFLIGVAAFAPRRALAAAGAVAHSVAAEHRRPGGARLLQERAAADPVQDQLVPFL